MFNFLEGYISSGFPSCLNLVSVTKFFGILDQLLQKAMPEDVERTRLLSRKGRIAGRARGRKPEAAERTSLLSRKGGVTSKTHSEVTEEKSRKCGHKVRCPGARQIVGLP